MSAPGLETRHTQLRVTDFSEAARLVAAECYGDLGEFGYQAFDWINAALFDGRLPTPLILWELTAHGACLGLTTSRPEAPPVIRLHPSLLGGPKPWAIPWPCAHCGQQFQPTWPTTKFCSFACRRKAEQARLHRRKQPEPPEEG